MGVVRPGRLKGAVQQGERNDCVILRGTHFTEAPAPVLEDQSRTDAVDNNYGTRNAEHDGKK